MNKRLKTINDFYGLKILVVSALNKKKRLDSQTDILLRRKAMRGCRVKDLRGRGGSSFPPKKV
jgi:hypothetical protein